MNDNYDIKVLCLLSLQRALLGNVIAKMRQGWLLIDEKKIEITFVTDGALSEDEEEILSIVETELIADLPSEYEVRLKITQSFQPVDKTYLFFLRHEQNKKGGRS